MNEEGIDFSIAKGVFYNPEMTFCRSMSSLAVGAIGGRLDVCDSFCASGIRGIRYAKENKNVKSVTFVDIEKSAIKCAEKNAKKARIRHDAIHGNISRVVFDIAADFLELDPFGTPAPYLYDAFRVFNPKKTAYLSATATDVAVLCGGKTKACMKNYHSRPLNNEFTHENGLRIMVKRMAETAAEFNMGIKPLVSFSDRHYLKAIVQVERSAELAYESMMSLGHVEYCPSCGYREAAKFPKGKCANCGKATDYAGPMWLGELHDKKFIDDMEKLNMKRSYSHKSEIEKMLGLLKGEIGMPPHYYNIHAFAKRAGIGFVPRTEDVIAALLKSGFNAKRTHFSPVSIKTGAPYGVLKQIFSEAVH
ncbi:tRNA (guanine(10)-N(2))-dimethyltransferase [Candidatus Micrarchaeota archaeon]|nr:tRNA (guanine(10)-N(2))-dimethyltransferase [Candidatus Micrarchaeota archaeon]